MKRERGRKSFCFLSPANNIPLTGRDSTPLMYALSSPFTVCVPLAECGLRAEAEKETKAKTQSSWSAAAATGDDGRLFCVGI